MSGSGRLGLAAAILGPKAHEVHDRQQREEHLKLARKGRLKCFACGKSASPNRVKCHPKLSVHVCCECHDVYHLGSFDVAEDGREIYCRMCGNGGTIILCSKTNSLSGAPCPFSFCVDCIKRNFGEDEGMRVQCDNFEFTCWICDDGPMEILRRRIPGYEHNSRNVLTSLITNPKKTSKGGSAKCPKPSASGRCSGSTNGGGGGNGGSGAAGGESHSASTTGGASSKSKGKQPQRAVARHVGPSSVLLASITASSKKARSLTRGASGASCSELAEEIGDVMEIGSRWVGGGPPEGPGKGATLLPRCCGRRSDGGRSSRVEEGERKGGGGDSGGWEESSDAGGLSTDSSDDSSSSCLSDSGYACSSSRGRGHGRRRERGSGGGEAARAERGVRPDVFEWDRRKSNGAGDRPVYSIDDLSRGMEDIGIEVINSEDDEKLPYFRYVTGYVMGGEVQQKSDLDSMVCCDCTAGCRDPHLCACLRLRAGKEGLIYQTGAVAGDKEFVRAAGGGAAAAAAAGEPGRRRFYNDDGLLLHLPEAIFECGSRCACNPHRCKNRVVSRGVHLRLQVFRCKPDDESGFDKGWGLRCIDSIPAGSFVACYLGEVLTDRAVDDRGRQTHDDYVFGLDFAQCARQRNGGGSSGGGGRGGSGGVAGSGGGGDWGLTNQLTPSRRGSVNQVGHGRSPSSSADGMLLGGAAGDRELAASPLLPLVGAPATKRSKCSSARSQLAASAAAVGAAGAAATAGEGLARAVEGRLLAGDGVSVSLSPEQEAAVEGFMSITGCADRTRAVCFVSGAGGVLETAVNHFLDAPAGAGTEAAAGASAAGAGAAAAAVVVDADDADDEREESDCSDHAASAASAATNTITATTATCGGGAGTGEFQGVVDAPTKTPPAGLSHQQRKHWVDAFNERERVLYRRQQQEEEEAESSDQLRRRRQQQQQSLPRPIPLGGLHRPFSWRSDTADDTAGGGKPAAPAPSRQERKDRGIGATPVGAAGAGSKTVSPPTSPAEVLWQDRDDHLRNGAGAGRAVAGRMGFPGASSSPARPASPSHAEAPVSRAFRSTSTGGVRGSGSMDLAAAAAAALVGRPASAHVLPRLAETPPSPLELIAASDSMEVVDVVAAEDRDVSLASAARWQKMEKDKDDGEGDGRWLTQSARPPSCPIGWTSDEVAVETTNRDDRHFARCSGGRRSGGVSRTSTPVPSPRSAPSHLPTPKHSPPRASSPRRRTTAASAAGDAGRRGAGGGGGGGGGGGAGGSVGWWLEEVDCMTPKRPSTPPNEWRKPPSTPPSASAKTPSAWTSLTPCSPRSDPSPELVVDAKEYGNVARFMNHSCDGNLLKTMVFVENHDSRMPRVAFFAPGRIEAYEELTYDYNYKVGSVEGRVLECHCGAGENCRGRLL